MPYFGIFVFLASVLFSWASSNENRRRAAKAAREQRELQNALLNRGHLVNVRSSDFYYPLIYGPCRVGGNRVYVATSGSGDKYIHHVLNLGLGPCEGIVRQDGSIYTTTGTQLPTSNPPLIYLDGELWTSTNKVSKCYFEWFNGSDSQNVCSTLSSAVPQWNLAQRHKAYLYCRFEYDSDLFLGQPEVTVVVAGLKCYDPYADSTAYTTNHALHAYDFITRPKILGGLGLDNWMAAPPATPRVVVATIEAARSYCEDLGWKGGIVLNENQDWVDNLGLILDCFRGDLINSATQYKLAFADLNYESSAMSLTEQDIVRQDGKTSLRIKPAAPLSSLPNALDVTHFSQELNYQKHTYLYPDITAITTDGDVRKKSMSLLGLNDLDTLQKMCNYYLERSRWGNIVSLEGRHKLMQLEPGDVIDLTHSFPGYSAQYLRVLSGSISQTGTVAITAIEEATALYDGNYNPALLVRYVPAILDLTDPPPSVINVSISEATDSTRQRGFTKLVVDFDPPTDYPWFDYAKVWLRKGVAGTWKYITKAETDWEFALVQEGETYYVRLQSVNTAGVAEDFNSAYTVSLAVQGRLYDTPANITGFIAVASGEAVTLRANNPGYDDVDGWEVRLGAAWNGGIFLTLLKDPSLAIPGVRPGSHTFWMAIKNNAGNYSGTPSSATCTILTPGHLTSDFSQTWDYTTGTHNNTEHDTYSSNDILKCSHTSGVLTGDWTSPTYDRGSIAKVRVWIEFSTVFFASSSTWGGVVPSPNDWDSINATTETWREIFEPTSAAQLNATLSHSTDASNWDDVTFFELVYAEVNARYFKINMQITDPALDANLYIYAVTLKSYTGPT